MSKTILIPIDKGYKYDSIDESAQVIKLVEIPKDIREEIQSVDDIFRLNKTTKEAFELKWKNFESHEIGHAFEILIVAAYNEGKLPDFTDETAKYYPRFRMGSPSGVGFSYFGYVRWHTFSCRCPPCFSW